MPSASRTLFAILVSSLIGGCATKPAALACDCGARACVEGSGALFPPDDNLNVIIQEVDGISPLARGYCVGPGVRRLRVAAVINGPHAYAYRDWMFESGRRYKVRASREAGNTIRFRLLDATDGRETQLAAFEGDRWPFRQGTRLGRPGVRGRTLLTVEGPAAAVVRDQASSSALRFAFQFGLLRDDGVCPHGFYGIVRGDECIAYVNRNDGIWLALAYSSKEQRSTVIFGSIHADGADAAFDRMIVWPLRDEFGREIRIVRSPE